MRRLALLRAALLLPLLVACAADRPAGARAPIVDGTRETGEPAVVMVKVVGGAFSCTGTFISPTLVLTAKHCVQGSGATAPYPPSIMSIGVGHDRNTTTDYRVRRVWTTPGRYFSDRSLSGLIGEDVAVVAIRPDAAGTLPDVPTVAFFREDPRSLIGLDMTFVGFGLRPDGGSGLKFKTTGVVDTVAGGVIYSSRNICQGDSGGPMIWEDAPGGRAIVGVASFGSSTSGTEPGCPADVDGHQSLFAHLGLIDAALYAEGECPPAGDEACNSLDDDCDGLVDEGCAGLGEACAADTDCALAQLPERFDPLPSPVVCGDTAAGRVCTRACDPLRVFTSCASTTAPFLGEEVTHADVYCARTGGCEGQCLPGTPGALGEGEPCAASADCGTLACIDPGDGVRRCLSPCAGDGGQCPEGLVCAAGAGVCSGCVDPAIVIGRRSLGEPCADAEECNSGLCLEDVTSAYCSLACRIQPDCPEGFHCRGDVCARGPLGSAGEPCSGDGDCAPPATCGTDGFCGNACDDPNDCPEGYACEAGVCAPQGAVFGAACVADADCVTGVCATVEGRSTCGRLCGADGACPAGFACRSPDAPGPLVCASPPSRHGGGGGGGCSVPTVPGRAPGAGLLLLALFALAARRGGPRRRP